MQWNMLAGIVVLAAILVAGITGSHSASLEEKNVLPNIIYAMADDLGYGDVGYNGGSPLTPHLDAMAAGPHTIHLTRYYSGAPVCSPTRGTVLTGRNHNRYCIWTANSGHGGDHSRPETMPLPTSEITVTEIFKMHGYHTATFGKWHMGDFTRERRGNKKWPVSHPGMHGFDEWLSTLRSAPTANPNCACFAGNSECDVGHYDHPFPCTDYYTVRSRRGSRRGNPETLGYPIQGDDSDFIYRQFEDYLERVLRSGKPFFVYLPFHAVHHSFVATDEYRGKYRAFSPTEADYFGAVSAMDAAMGKIRALLVKHGIQNNTMLWFTSDNGPERHTPGSTGGFRERKQSLYEGGIRVPGLVEWPAMISRNLKTDYPVMSNDFFPTVCDIVGIKPPSDRPIDGESLIPFIKGEVTARRTSMKWAFNFQRYFDGRSEYQAAISDNWYKLYARYRVKEATLTELYDLSVDPHEEEDIKFVAEGGEVHDRMKRELDAWLDSLQHSARDVVKCL